jgi:hypothetical protein
MTDDREGVVIDSHASGACLRSAPWCQNCRVRQHVVVLVGLVAYLAIGRAVG